MSEKNSKRHPVAGDPGWEPKVEAPKVAKEARHGNPDARPEGSGGPNQPKSTSRELLSPAPLGVKAPTLRYLPAVFSEPNSFTPTPAETLSTSTSNPRAALTN